MYKLGKEIKGSSCKKVQLTTEQQIFDLKDLESKDAPFAAFAIFMLGNTLSPRNKLPSCPIVTLSMMPS